MRIALGWIQSGRGLLWCSVVCDAVRCRMVGVVIKELTAACWGRGEGSGTDHRPLAGCLADGVKEDEHEVHVLGHFKDCLLHVKRVLR